MPGSCDRFLLLLRVQAAGVQMGQAVLGQEPSIVQDVRMYQSMGRLKGCGSFNIDYKSKVPLAHFNTC